jgi:hypothetical protein
VVFQLIVGAIEIALVASCAAAAAWYGGGAFVHSIEKIFVNQRAVMANSASLAEAESTGSTTAAPCPTAAIAVAPPASAPADESPWPWMILGVENRVIAVVLAVRLRRRIWAFGSPSGD